MSCGHFSKYLLTARGYIVLASSVSGTRLIRTTGVKGNCSTNNAHRIAKGRIRCSRAQSIGILQSHRRIWGAVETYDRKGQRVQVARPRRNTFVLLSRGPTTMGDEEYDNHESGEVSWPHKTTTICPSLTRGSPGACLHLPRSPSHSPYIPAPERRDGCARVHNPGGSRDGCCGDS